MNKEKFLTCMQQRIDLLSIQIKELSNRLFELEKWLDKIENGDFD